jgi:hypothetical protein
MNTDKNKFRIYPGCRFVERNTGTVYIVREVSPKTVMYRTVDGQKEFSSCACSAKLFESKVQNKAFEIIQ